MATTTTGVSVSTSKGGAGVKALQKRACPDYGMKTVAIKFKDDGLAEGEFIGYASIFGNKDSYGDVVIKGAFDVTLAEWERSGLKIPVLWGHNTADPDFNLGECITAEEDSKGLRVHVKLDLECPKAASTYRLLKAGRVNQMSFAYKVIDGAYIMPEGEEYSYRDAYFELRELQLYEVSVVPIGANDQTEILAVKSFVNALAAKAGRSLSSKNEDAIRTAAAQLEDALTALKSVLPDDEPADDDGDDPKAGDAGVESKDPDQTTGTEAPPESDSSSGQAPPSPSVSQATEIDEIEMALAIATSEV